MPRMLGPDLRKWQGKAPIILETISTPADIITIPDGADDLPMAMTVGIEPVQDLHGYDNPWPAGGGKNKINILDKQSTTSAGLTGKCENGIITITGTSNDNASLRFPLGASVNIDPANNKIAFNNSAIQGNLMIGFYRNETRIHYWTASEVNRVISGWSDTGNENIDEIIIECTSGNAVNMTIGIVLMDKNISDTAFAPYSNICPISGWTGAKVTRTGKNLIGLKHSPDRSAYNNGVTVSDETDEHFTLTSNGQSWRYRSLYYALKAGTYTLSMKATSTTSGFAPTISLYYPTDTPGISTSTGFDSAMQATSSTFTVIEDCVIEFRFFATLGTATTQSATFYDVQLEVGSSATAYEAFKLFAEYDITFPASAGTVYGGTLTVNKDGSGELVVDRVCVRLTKSLPWSIGGSGTNRRFNTHYTDYFPLSSGVDGSFISSHLEAENIGYNTNKFGKFYISGSNWIVVHDNNEHFSTLTDFNNWLDSEIVTICYELATPVTYPLTPGQVKTLLGVNNIWADTGDILSVTYPADTKLYVDHQIAQKVSASQRLMELIVTANHEDEMKATKAYSTGDLLIVNGTLYKTTASIANGANLTVNTNVTATTVAAELAALA